MMNKKIITVGLSLLLSLGLGTSAFAETVGTEKNFINSNVLNLTSNTDFFDKPVTRKNIKTFNNSNIRDYLNYETILINNDILKQIDTNKIVQLIDNGVTLWIEDENVSLKNVSQKLKLNEPDDRFVKGAKVTGAIIFNHNNNYCYGVTGKIDIVPEDCKEEQQTEDDDFSMYEPIPISQSGDRFENITIKDNDTIKVNIKNFTDTVEKFRSDFDKHAIEKIENNKVYMQLPNKAFDGSPYYNYFSFNGGSLAIAQYRYNICVFRDNNINKAVTDVITTFTISPINSNMYVNNYKTRMHANISNMDIIGQSYLNSNSSSSYSLSGGVSMSSNGKVIQGNLGASTTNSYTTNNQTIGNDFYNRKYKNWNVEPTQKWKGVSWEIEPCIRILNTNASSYKNQAYSSFQQGGWVGVLNVFGYTIPEFEVGGAW